MTNLPQVRERIGAADFQTVAKFLPQSELGGTLAVSENEKAVVMRGGRVVDMFSGRSGRTPADSEVVVTSLRYYHMVFGFGDCSRSPYNRAPSMIHVPDLPEIEASSGEILRSMTVAIRFSLIRDDRSNVEKLLALNAARRDAVTVRDLANDLDLPAFISAIFASAETSDERSIRFDEPYRDKVRQRILMAANMALGEYGVSASAAILDIYATSRDAPRRLTESQREELAKHNSRMTQLDAQIEAEKRRLELESLSNQREMLRTATMKHLEEQAEIQVRVESLDPRPSNQADPTKPRPSAPSAEPPSKPRNRIPLIAAGFFGATIVIILVTLLASQSGDSALDSPTRIAAVAPPTSTPTPSPIQPTYKPLPTSAPPPTLTSAPPPTLTSTPSPTPTYTPTPHPIQPTYTPSPTSTTTPTPHPTATWTPTPFAVDSVNQVNISAGGGHTCALRENGAAECWGDNGWGQSDPPDETFVAISAGRNTTCALREDGDVKCWGEDSYVPPPAGPFVAISAGGNTTCALREDGAAECWGDNYQGQTNPPAGTFHAISVNSHHTCALRESGAVECWGIQLDPPAGSFVAISASLVHACALRENGRAECWGSNVVGQSDHPTGAFAAISAGEEHACALREDGAAECWGFNADGRSNPPAGPFVAIGAGGAHTCALRVDGAAECWGDNADGRSNPPAGVFRRR